MRRAGPERTTARNSLAPWPHSKMPAWSGTPPKSNGPSSAERDLAPRLAPTYLPALATAAFRGSPGEPQLTSHGSGLLSRGRWRSPLSPSASSWHLCRAATDARCACHGNLPEETGSARATGEHTQSADRRARGRDLPAQPEPLRGSALPERPLYSRPRTGPPNSGQPRARV